jgi:hypothetical protein
MRDLQRYLGKEIEVEISGDKWVTGCLQSIGSDLLVVYGEQQFYYIPFVHVQQIKRSTLPPLEPIGEQPVVAPLEMSSEKISYRKMLMNAKGRFVEVYVTGGKSIHGYLTSIMNNYFVFYSPVYKTVYISLEHVKWLVPYPTDVTPYSMSHKDLHVNPSMRPLSRTFEEQCKRLAGNLVVFDLGDDSDKIGLLVSVEDSQVEMVTANCETRFWNVRHLKTVHVP